MNFFSLNFPSIEIEGGGMVSPSQNKCTLGGGEGVGVLLENEQGRTRREGACQNSGIMSERTFWMYPNSASSTRPYTYWKILFKLWKIPKTLPVPKSNFDKLGLASFIKT